MIVISRLLRQRFALLGLLFVYFQVASPGVLADGGAPQLAYIAGAARGVSIIDIAQRRVIGTMTPASVPAMVLLSQDGQALFLALPESGQVAVLAAKTGKMVCSVNLSGQPSLLALSLDGGVLYAAGAGDSKVHAINPVTCLIERTFETREPVYGLAITADTSANATPSTPNQLWIAGSTSLTVFDVTGHFFGSLPIPGGPQYISIPGGFTAYVTTRTGSVVAVDLNSRTLVGTLLSGGQFGPMDYDATTGKVYVPDRQHHQLEVLTPVTSGSALPRESGRIWQMNGSPQSIAITSDGQFGFVALSNGQVEMLDIPARSLMSSVEVGGTPHFIITGLYPPAVASISDSKQGTSSSTPTNFVFLLASVCGLLVLLALGFYRVFRRRIRLWLVKRRRS